MAADVRDSRRRGRPGTIGEEEDLGRQLMTRDNRDWYKTMESRPKRRRRRCRWFLEDHWRQAEVDGAWRRWLLLGTMGGQTSKGALDAMQAVPSCHVVDLMALDEKEYRGEAEEGSGDRKSVV